MTADLTLEQAVLHAALVRPGALDMLLRGATPEDFAHPVHRRIVEHLQALRQDEREPSVISVMTLFGDDELEPGLKAKDYVSQLFVGGGQAAFAAPLRDLFETWRDTKHRSTLVAIGRQLEAMSVATSVTVGEALDVALGSLSDVKAELQTSKPKSYGTTDATEDAFEAMLGEAKPIISTGLVDLDRMLGGWARGQLTIVAGRPAMGKSTVGLSTALRSAKAGHGVVMFNLEMTRQQVGARLMADASYGFGEFIAYDDIIGRRVGDHGVDRLKRAAKAISELPLRFEEQRGLTLAAITTKAKHIAADMDRKGEKLDIVMIDHIGLVKPSNRYAGMRHREIAEITDGLATLAKDIDCAVIGLCQLNRGVEGRENKRPTLADLRDSGSIEEDASAVVFLYRDAYYLQLKGQEESAEDEMRRQEMLKATRNSLDLVVAKNRNGRTGIVPVFVEMGASAVRNSDFGSRR